MSRQKVEAVLQKFSEFGLLWLGRNWNLKVGLALR